MLRGKHQPFAKGSVPVRLRVACVKFEYLIFTVIVVG
jgi:hypothetical protein